jgi:hypothetical protein
MYRFGRLVESFTRAGNLQAKLPPSIQISEMLLLQALFLTFGENKTKWSRKSEKKTGEWQKEKKKKDKIFNLLSISLASSTVTKDTKISRLSCTICFTAGSASANFLNSTFSTMSWSKR